MGTIIHQSIIVLSFLKIQTRIIISYLPNFSSQPEPLQCTGKEERLSHCPLRMNGQIYGHEYGCDWEGKDFVFINCGARNLDPTFDYWGGLRFSVKEFETEMFHERIHDAVNDNNNRRKHESIVEYVQVRK